MSKVDRILYEELDPEDRDPMPRGGSSKSGCSFWLLAVFLVVLAVVAGCKTGQTAPSTPTVAVSCEQPSPDCRGGEVR